MKKVNKSLKTREDSRGTLTELFRGRFFQCNLLQMRKGSVWGKHYHKKTAECFYLLEGEIKVFLYSLKTKKEESKTFKIGDSFTIKPYTVHTIKVCKGSLCLVLYSKQFSQEKPDLFRL